MQQWKKLREKRNILIGAKEKAANDAHAQSIVSTKNIRIELHL